MRCRCWAAAAAALLGVAAAVRDDDASAAVGLTLEWSDISYAVPGTRVNGGGRKGRGSRREKILDSVSGRARPARLLAILGSSGCGKSSLLNAIAGTIDNGKKGVTLIGEVTVNGKRLSSVEEMHEMLAFVRQHNSFYPFLTVKETMMMSAHLRLGGWSTEMKQAHVNAIMEKLGLHLVADVLVGDDKMVGISGGERKRLAIGMAMIGLKFPSILFLDEPTSGLDSFQAQKVMEDLKALCDEGNTIITTIHQPRSSIFALIDDLILLSEGQVIYNGEGRQTVIAHFEKLGYNCPLHYNPADFLLDTISLDYSATHGLTAERNRLRNLAREGERAAASGSLEVVEEPKSFSTPSSNHARCGPITQFRLLFMRSWRQVTRDLTAAKARVVGGALLGVTFGSVFWQFGKGVNTVNSRLSLIVNVVVNGAMVGVVRALRTFAVEKPVIMRERLEEGYSMAALVTAKVASELPLDFVFPLIFGPIVYAMSSLNPAPGKFTRYMGLLMLECHTSSAMGLMLGALFPEDAALVLGPALNVIMLIVSGMNTNIPGPLKRLESLSTLKWAIFGMLSNEFTGLRMDADVQPLRIPIIGKLFAPPASAGQGVVKGEDVLKELPISMDGMNCRDDVHKAAWRLASLAAAFHSITLAYLSWTRPHFTKMLPSTFGPDHQNVREDMQIWRMQSEGEGAKSKGSSSSSSSSSSSGSVKSVPTVRVL